MDRRGEQAVRYDVVARPHRLVAKDTTLSRWRHGFEPRWGCQEIPGHGASRLSNVEALANLLLILLLDASQNT